MQKDQTNQRTTMAVILIAGAIPDLPALLPSLLRKDGHDIHIMTSHSKLWATIALLRPALILIDENMKTHSGKKFCRDIKQNKNTQHIAVILLSVDSAFPGHADDIIKRPFETGLFRETIKRILEK